MARPLLLLSFLLSDFLLLGFPLLDLLEADQHMHTTVAEVAEISQTTRQHTLMMLQTCPMMVGANLRLLLTVQRIGEFSAEESEGTKSLSEVIRCYSLVDNSGILSKMYVS